MGRTALQKLERRVDSSVNSQLWAVFGEGHGQMDFYLILVMSSHGTFNTYPFHVRLAESPKCANCNWRGRGDDAWRTLFKGSSFQPYQEDLMTILQEIGEQPLYQTLGPNHSKEGGRIQMKPYGCLCRVDIAPQDGISVRVAKATLYQCRPSPSSSPSCLPLATQQQKMILVVNINIDNVRWHPITPQPSI